MMDDNSFWAKLSKILDFQFSDLKKCHSAGANFLAAMACMNTVEFLGGVRNGKLGLRGCVESRFKEGVRLLGGGYMGFGEDRMWELRNSLTHEYLARVETFARILIASVLVAVPVDKPAETLKIGVINLITDLEDAADRLKEELQQDSDMMSRAKVALSRIADLL